jgi:hypothetical protein
MNLQESTEWMSETSVACKYIQKNIGGTRVYTMTSGVQVSVKIVLACSCTLCPIVKLS